MRYTILSRRTALKAGPYALAAAVVIPSLASAARAETGLSPSTDITIRKYYRAWEQKDWRPMDILLADDFTFSSPLDDHISKRDFKSGCWDTQIAHIERFDLKQLIGTDNAAFVLYVCHTTSGKTFQNVEFVRLQRDQVKAVECYFGAKSSFPSAVDADKG
jgi:hypothetical protein